MPKINSFLRDAWESKPTRVVGLWFVIFVALNWIVPDDPNADPGQEEAGLALYSAIAGAIATLQWMWLERTGVGLLKALIFGGLLTLVVFGMMMLASNNAATAGY